MRPRKESATGVENAVPGFFCAKNFDCRTLTCIMWATSKLPEKYKFGPFDEAIRISKSCGYYWEKPPFSKTPTIFRILYRVLPSEGGNK